MIKLKKGLDLPITGEPEQVIRDQKDTSTIAVLGIDYVGMKPTMMVRVSDEVKLGQVLFTDKKNPSVKYTSPGSGRVIAIRRGEKRALLSVVIELSGDAEITFNAYTPDQLSSLAREKVVEQLLESGSWTALRARPFSKVANPETTPHSIFITAMDTNPLAPSIEKILDGQEENFRNGLQILSKLTDGKLHLCKSPGANIPDADLENLSVEEFDGPHPAGLVGTHIHFLDPVGRQKTVWYIGVQDVVAFGKLFTTGKIHVERIVALAGPAVKEPRLVKTRIGASLTDVTARELNDDDNRIISGSILAGHAADEAVGFLGRYHQQISVIAEDSARRFLGWMDPGLNLFSVKNIVLSKLFPGKKFKFSTSTNGEHRPIVPSGNYGQVMPLDILPLFLMRALAVDDVEEAESLGCLELDEEDLALCAFVCPSKLDFGPLLRRNLTMIEKEG